MTGTSQDLFFQAVLLPSGAAWLQLVMDRSLLIVPGEALLQAESAAIPPDAWAIQQPTGSGWVLPRESPPLTRELAEYEFAEWWQQDGLQEWFARRLRLLAAGLDPGLLLRINVVDTSPRLWVLPWEWLEIGLRPLLGSQRFCVLRATLEYFTPSRLVLPAHLRVLAAVSQAEKSPEAIDPQAELAPLHASSRGLELRTTEANRKNLRQTLADWQPHVLHLTSHAGIDGEEGNLILTDPQGGVVDWLDARDMMSLLQPSVRLLCLSTCFTVPNYEIRGFSRLVLAAIKGGSSALMPSIVYTQFPITAHSAGLFWPRFYDYLQISGGDLVGAVAEARNHLKASDSVSADWSSFVLVLNDSFTPDRGRPFVLTPRTSHTVTASPPPRPSSFGEGVPSVGEGMPSISEMSLKEIESYYVSNLANRLAERLRVYEASNLSSSSAAAALSPAVAELQSALEGVKKYLAE